jgi:hypothetical protein
MCKEADQGDGVIFGDDFNFVGDDIAEDHG